MAVIKNTLKSVSYTHLDFQRIIFFPKVLYIWGKRLGFINGIFPLGNMKSIKPVSYTHLVRRSYGLFLDQPLLRISSLKHSSNVFALSIIIFS